jgi:hypothetical protein
MTFIITDKKIVVVDIQFKVFIISQDAKYCVSTAIFNYGPKTGAVGTGIFKSLLK